MDIKIVMYLVIQAFVLVIAWHACDFAAFHFRRWNDHRRLNNAVRKLVKATEAAARENETARGPEPESENDKMIKRWTDIKKTELAKYSDEIMHVPDAVLPKGYGSTLRPPVTMEFPIPSPTPEADPFQKKPRAMTAKIKRKSKSRK